MKNNTRLYVAIVTLFMAAVLCIDVIELFTPENKISVSFSIVGAILALYYGVIGYKKPNGNMMKVLFVAYGSAIGAYAIFRAGKYVPTAYLYFICSVIIVYISGRLDKIKKNTYLIIVAFVAVLLGYILKCGVRGDGILTAIRLADEVYILIALYAFYFLRYKEHKAAGLVDTL